MKRIVVSAAALCLPLFAQVAPMGFQPPAWGGPAMPHVEGAQSGPVHGRPVAGKETRRTTQTLGDGTTVDHAEVSYFHRDGLGRMREESAERVEVFDPVSHVEYDMHPKDKTYQKLPLSNDAAFMSVAVVGGTSMTSVSGNADGGPHNNHGGATEDLGRQMVNGVMAKGSRTTLTIPAGAFGNNRDVKVVNESWYSEDLRVLVKSINNDPRFGVSVYELTNIDQLNPDAALFAPPADYRLTARERH